MYNRFCAKILPLEYDDSISYYEQLCKLTRTINDILDLINGDITGTIEKYINDSFNNLMINAIYDENTETIYFNKGVKNERI